MNHKETVKRLLPMGTLEEEPRYVNEKQFKINNIHNLMLFF